MSVVTKVALAAMEKEVPDVMVLDVRMPGMSGLELLKQIRAEHPHVQVIIVTGHASHKDMKLARELGAYDYLEKPVDIGELAEKIKAAKAKAAAIAPMVESEQTDGTREGP